MIKLDKETAKSIFYHAGPRILATLVNLLLIPIVLASFEVADYGIYALYLSVALASMIFTFPRISFESKVDLARGDDEAFLACLSDRFLLSLPILILPVPVVLLGEGLTAELNILLFAAVFYGTLFPNILFQAVSSYFIAKEEFLWSSALELFRALIAGGFSALAAHKTNDLEVYALVKGALDFSIIFFAFLILSFKRNLISPFRRKTYRKSVRNFGIKMVVSDATSTLRLQSTLWIVAFFVGAEGVAVIQVAFSSMYRRVANHVLTLVNVFYAKVARGLPSGQKIDSPKSVFLMLGIGSILAFFTIGLAFNYVKWLLPEAFSQVLPLFTIIVAALPFALASKLVMLKFLVNLASAKITLVVISSALVQIIFCIILVNSIGLIGACIAIVIGSVFELAVTISASKWQDVEN
ncbi:lipopolysaccharide biosynthesis protein [Rhodovulum sp. YNF3179]|uniref:lipopolysaccharide biosynthesis protein n=1 Tax=Rhodovulum sp. YNF3179 TaxID=3425127 RepID=UPI003D335B8C